MLFFTLLQMVSGQAQAQETLDLGVLDYSDLQVVQNQLYTKKGKSEMGAHVGLMPFNPYTLTPKVEFSYGQHMQENLGWEVAVGGGYSFKNGAFRTLESPSYAISPDAYRYLSSVLVMHNILQFTQNELEWKGCISPRHLLYWRGWDHNRTILLPDKDMAFLKHCRWVSVLNLQHQDQCLSHSVPR